MDAAGAPGPQLQHQGCAPGESLGIWGVGVPQVGSILTSLPASQEGPAPGGPPGSPQVEAMLRELGELWEDLQRKHQENGAVLREIDKVRGGSRAGGGHRGIP